MDSDAVVLTARYNTVADLPQVLGSLRGLFARGSLREFYDSAVVWEGGSYDQAVSV